MRIVTYNIRKGVGLDRKRDPMRILRVLRKIDADIVVLQEADRRLGKRPSALPLEMIRGETDYQIVDHAGSDVSLGWHGNAMLVREGLKHDSTDRVDLPGLEPRGAICTAFDGMTVVGTHLGLLRFHRHQQMERIRDLVGGDASRPALVAGDFNEWSETSGFEPWEDMFDVLRPGRTFHAARPMARLDGFAATPVLNILKAGIQETDEASIASDHLPTWIDIERETHAGTGAEDRQSADNGP
ncbi:endonuclease/exonuclease/phosphatase family protein [Pseudaestuariivita atlantica]|uniref:Metal-dependent hydrolase n=1 Tax=Pseudaestuariivita atlantica TaxID=1317121 RepID=A0A0L1JN28_9RHOB|nr:endonuclease/exonuclease/phosphatase family protein [Pseudaestuariivita atlantica]KNG93112.1 metal-dependent hydrolase [Pseudaestuariivita atlantica]